jgi:nucleoid-associated protein YgaU
MTQIKIQRGDTLWSLAGKHLGDPKKWKLLYAANWKAIEREQRKYTARSEMTGPDWIFPGTTLNVPDR